MRGASPSSPTLFVSDIHLCPTRPEMADLFFGFLDHQARQAEALYILGDLFEYWAGDDDLATHFNAAVGYALKHLTGHGTRVFLLPGNRDFLLGNDFAYATGVNIIQEPHLVTLCEVPTLLLHGDTLCSDDVKYAEFRAEVRNPAWRKEFLAKPLAERKALVEELRRRSEEEKRNKPAALMDVNPDTVAELLRGHNYPRLIHGHTHRQSCYTHIVDGHRCQRWVLGDWDRSGNYLACDESGISFHALLPA